MYQGRYSREAVLAERRRRRARGKGMLIAALALAGVLAVGGMFAYFTDETESLVNTFESTDVTCAVVEDTTSQPGVKQNVGVVNTGDIDAYIRAKVVVNWMDAEGVISGIPVESSDCEMTMGNGWVLGADGFWYWLSPVAPEAVTDPLILSCSQSKNAPNGYYLAVEILSSAVQAEGVDSDGAPAVVNAWPAGVASVADDGKLTIIEPSGE